MPSVLFVCTANQFRSPLAAACFQRELDRLSQAPGWHVDSAGTWVVRDAPLSPYILRALRPLGIDLGAHRPRPVTADLLREQDLVIVMESGHRESLLIDFPFVRARLFLLSEVISGIPYDIPDPDGRPGTSLQELATEICVLVRSGFSAICTKALDLSREGA